MIFGPLLNVTLDIAIVYTQFFEPPYPHASVLRYMLSLLYTRFVYLSWLPWIQWILVQENFQSGPWQLSVQTVFLFSIAVPLTSTLCTEFSMIALSVQDPFLSTRFYMVPPPIVKPTCWSFTDLLDDSLFQRRV
jgi:ABC-type microcin C transport system permease subunit YejB